MHLNPQDTATFVFTDRKEECHHEVMCSLHRLHVFRSTTSMRGLVRCWLLVHLEGSDVPEQVPGMTKVR